MRTSSNDIRRGNMGTHPSKEQDSSRTNKDGKSMLNITYRDRKTNIWIREETNVTDAIEQVIGQKSHRAEVDLGRARQPDTR